MTRLWHSGHGCMNTILAVLTFQPNYRFIHSKKYLFTLSKKYIFWIKVSQKLFNLILKKEALHTTHLLEQAGKAYPDVMSTQMLPAETVSEHISRADMSILPVPATYVGKKAILQGSTTCAWVSLGDALTLFVGRNVCTLMSVSCNCASGWLAGFVVYAPCADAAHCIGRADVWPFWAVQRSSKFGELSSLWLSIDHR